MKRLLIVLNLMLVANWCSGQNIEIKPIIGGPNTSYRGLSVVNESVAWLGGSKGWTAYTIDGGKHFVYRQVPGYEKCDFRSVYAINASTVVIANAGSPAYILRTTDTGKTWQKVYENPDSLAFYDGIDFWNKCKGIVYGDPIGGKMMVLNTKDGGKTWLEAPQKSRPELLKGEASFAASGTTIRTQCSGKVYIATGGTVSRLWISGNKGKSWKSKNTPILQGKASTGIFSFTIQERTITIVGGDYLQDTLKQNNCFISENGGKTWVQPMQPPRGYRECLTYVAENVLLTCGPGGIDLSGDGGKHWYQSEDAKGYHVCKKARNGGLIIIAGSNGQIGLVRNFVIVAD